MESEECEYEDAPLFWLVRLDMSSATVFISTFKPTIYYSFLILQIPSFSRKFVEIAKFTSLMSISINIKFPRTSRVFYCGGGVSGYIDLQGPFNCHETNIEIGFRGVSKTHIDRGEIYQDSQSLFQYKSEIFRDLRSVQILQDSFRLVSGFQLKLQQKLPVRRYISITDHNGWQRETI